MWRSSAWRKVTPPRRPASCDAHFGATPVERNGFEAPLGLQRARTQGKRLGRPQVVIPVERVARVADLSVAVAAERLGVSRSAVNPVAPPTVISC